VAANVYYYPSFLSEAQQATLTALIDEPDETRPWQTLTQRRLKMYGGTPVASAGGTVAETVPHWLPALWAALERVDVVAERGLRLNHVLLNEYVEGRGIGWHQDGPLYHDCALVLSLGGDALMRFFERGKEGERGGEAHVLLRRGSLLIFTDEAYTRWHHGIATATADRLDDRFLANAATLEGLHVGDLVARPSRRLSLTVRAVKAVAERPALQTAEQRSELTRRAQTFYHNVSELGHDDESRDMDAY